MKNNNQKCKHIEKRKT